MAHLVRHWLRLGRLAGRQKIRTPVFDAASHLVLDHPCDWRPIGEPHPFSFTPLTLHVHNLLHRGCSQSLISSNFVQDLSHSFTCSGQDWLQQSGNCRSWLPVVCNPGGRMPPAVADPKGRLLVSRPLARVHAQYNLGVLASYQVPCFCEIRTKLSVSTQDLWPTAYGAC